MRFFLLKKIIEILKANPKALKKFKNLVLVALAGGAIFFVVIVWAGVSLINTTAGSLQKIAESNVTQEYVKDLKTSTENFPKLQLISCLVKAQSLLDIQPWLEASIFENITSLKRECFKIKEPDCQSADCKQETELINTTKGSVI